jgi:hypothetical protein
MIIIKKLFRTEIKFYKYTKHNPWCCAGMNESKSNEKRKGNISNNPKSKKKTEN